MSKKPAKFTSTKPEISAADKALILKAATLVEKGRCIWVHARDKRGIPCSPLMSEAVVFDPMGALRCVTGDDAHVYDRLAAIIRWDTGTTMAGFNTNQVLVSRMPLVYRQRTAKETADWIRRAVQ